MAATAPAEHPCIPKRHRARSDPTDMQPLQGDNTMPSLLAAYLSIPGREHALLDLVIDHKGKAALDLHRSHAQIRQESQY